MLFAVSMGSCGDDPSAPPPPGDETPITGDHTAPEPVTDLSLSFDPIARVVRLAWTAPRDDAEHDRVTRYEIRYAYSFPMDWWATPQVDDPPVPSIVGSPQQYTIARPTHGRDLYAAIRCVDAEGNRSQVSSIAHVLVAGFSFEATCVDAMTSAPVAGLEVHIDERFAHDFVTGADGRVRVTDVVGALAIRVDRGAATAAYYGLDQAFTLDADRVVTYPMIEFAPADNAPYQSVLQILLDAVVGSEPILKKWANLPVPWYAPAFVNVNGLDYYDAASRAAARWNEATGLPLFVAVGSPPAIGVIVEFLPPAQMGGQNGFTSYTSDAHGYPVLDRVRIVDSFFDASRLYSIMLHELGHTIRLDHLNSPNMIMFAGQPLPADISNDEIRAVQLMTALPNGLNLAIYDDSLSR